MENEFKLGQIVHWNNGGYWKGTFKRIIPPTPLSDVSTHAEVENVEIFENNQWRSFPSPCYPSLFQINANEKP